jgi:hypothetical protein
MGRSSRVIVGTSPPARAGRGPEPIRIETSARKFRIYLEGLARDASSSDIPKALDECLRRGGLPESSRYRVAAESLSGGDIPVLSRKDFEATACMLGLPMGPLRAALKELLDEDAMQKIESGEFFDRMHIQRVPSSKNRERGQAEGHASAKPAKLTPIEAPATGTQQSRRGRMKKHDYDEMRRKETRETMIRTAIENLGARRDQLSKDGRSHWDIISILSQDTWTYFTNRKYQALAPEFCADLEEIWDRAHDRRMLGWKSAESLLADLPHRWLRKNWRSQLV